jgi:hypothetical protein
LNFFFFFFFSSFSPSIKQGFFFLLLMSGVAPQEESESDSSFSNESGAEGFHFPSSAESAKLRKDSGAVGIVERHHDKHDKMGALLGLSPGSVRRERNMVSAQRGEKLTSVAELYIS